VIARVRILAVTFLLVVSGAAPARAHSTDLAPGPPTTYAEVVQRIREQVRWIEEARVKGDLSDVDLHATELERLVGFVPALSMSVPGVFADSAVGRILRAGLRIGAAARSAHEAVAGQERERLAQLTTQFAAGVATLDAWVPKRYVCPMHCEAARTYDHPGRCPMCGMDLQLVTSDRYTVAVTPRVSPIRARAPVMLDFRIKDPTGFEVARLQTVHEKKMHLMIVSYDLAEFDHVHPVQGDDGGFSLRHVFRNGGRYVLYHDFTPDSVGMQVVPVELVVQGAERPRASLVVDDDAAKKVDGCDVVLSHDPLIPGREVAMTFTLTRGRKPITDLEPYLGTMGHLVVISEDRAAFVHSHPRESSGTGPSVVFRMRFERTGLYKAWGQFQRKGRVITVPFVVRVSADGRGGNDPLGAGAVR
jgi:Heavy metal binding domain